MPNFVNIEIDLGEIDSLTNSIIGRMRQGEALIATLASNMHAAVMLNFENGNSQWAPLSEATLERRRKSKSPQTLRDSGILCSSLTEAHYLSASLSGNDEAVAEVYTNIDYAKYHLTGTRYMPQRNFFDMNINAIVDETIDELLDVICRGM